MAAMYTDRISDIISRDLHMQIMDNITTNQRIITATAIDGHRFSIAVDAASIALSDDPQKIIIEATRKLKVQVDQYNNQLQGAYQSIQNGQYAMAQQQTATASAQLQNAMNQQQYALASQAAQQQSTFYGQPSQMVMYGNLLSEQPNRHGRIGEAAKTKPEPKKPDLKQYKYKLGTMGLFDPFKHFFKDMWRVAWT